MAINRISIENFTIFDKMEMGFCDGVNIFIGENGTGKTHLLKILYALCEWGAGNPKKDIDSFAQKLLNSFQCLSFETLSHCDFKSSRNVKPIKVSSSVQGQNREHIISEYAANSLAYRYTAHGDQEKYQMVFIPAKEMLTHSRLEKDYLHRDLPFDITLIDILNKAGVSTVRELPNEMGIILSRIAQIIGGKVLYKNDRYYIEKQNGELVDFALEAEGFKKLGLIYRLIETGYLEKGSVLIWDEPEANLNPKWLPFVVEILLELSRRGVQIFIATHEYNLMKYFSVKKNGDNEVSFCSFYKTDSGVAYEREDDYDLLEHNVIVDASIKLLEDDLVGAL